MPFRDPSSRTARTAAGIESWRNPAVLLKTRIRGLVSAAPDEATATPVIAASVSAVRAIIRVGCTSEF